jgi:hypothetical protein
LSQAEIKSLSFDDILRKCLARIQEIEELPEGQEKQLQYGSIPGLILVKPESSDIFHQLVQECFPEIVQPHKLTDEVKAQILVIFMSALANSMSSAFEQLQSL